MIRNVLVAALGVVFTAGCCHHRCHKSPCSGPGGPPPAGAYLLPPANVPTTPIPPAGGGVIPSVTPPDMRNYPPPVLGPVPSNPARPGPEVLFPDPIPGSGSSRNSSPAVTPAGGVFGPPAKPQTAEPPVSGARPAAATGLPAFVRVKDGLASGRKSTLDGFDALKRAGFRTVVYLHPAGTDVSAAKDVAEKRGLAFVGIEATPEKLAAAVEQFNATLADKAARPAYVCDDDGVRAGVLWYLHFRTAESENDDAARVRARPLGLADEGEDAKAFWLAAQRFLETR